jgi:hypothetical protein
MIFCSHHGFIFPRAPNPLDTLPSHFFPDIASRITTLELPVVWAQEWCKDHYDALFDVFWELQGFTALKHLTMNFEALCSDLSLSHLSNPIVPFPESLNSLTISHVDGTLLIQVLKCLGYYIVDRNRGCELSRIDIWTHERSCPGTNPSYDELLVLSQRTHLMQYVASVNIHYDAHQSSYIRKTLMAKERNGRPMGKVEYFGLESRGWFEKFREQAYDRDREAREQETWLSKEDQRIFKQREIAEERRKWMEGQLCSLRQTKKELRLLDEMLSRILDAICREVALL